MSDVKDILPPPFEWIEVPAGRVVLARKQETFDVPAFAIAKYPVTNVQYQVFVDSIDGYQDPSWWDYSKDARIWREQNSQPVPSKFAGDSCPRESVTWYDTVAFCRWLTARLNGATPLLPEALPYTSEPNEWCVMLPTEQQWQRAAQGDDGRIYPWGNKFDPEKCNTSEGRISHTTDVDHYPQGASPFGVMDMSGNVGEWCLTVYKNPMNTSLTIVARRVLRGGAWGMPKNYARVIARYDDHPLARRIDTGFRVVIASSPVK